MNIVIISIFGVLGILTRYSADMIWQNKSDSFPLSTFIVNIIGCFIAGYIYTLISKKVFMSEQTAKAILIGFCGGLTTFSSYCLQTVNLMQIGDFFKAFLYITVSIGAGLIMISLGLKSATYLS